MRRTKTAEASNTQTLSDGHSVRFAAQFYREPESKGCGWLVDISGIGTTQGETLEECHDMARDAVTETLLADFEANRELRLPGKVERTTLPAGQDWEWVYPFQAAWAAMQVKLARQAAGITVDQAARACLVARPTYLRWEDPYKSNATVKTLEKVAQALGRHLEVVFS